MFQSCARSSVARWRRVVLAFFCLSLLATTAFAGPSRKELSRARVKFQQGTELEQAGDWSTALTRFREVGQVKMTPQVRYHVALCEEHLGQLAVALGGYKLALQSADEVRARSFKSTVQSHIKDLSARIPKVVIKRGDGAEAASIELDGVRLGVSSIGVPVPVDPGPHTISAKAPGHEPFSKTMSVKEKQQETVEIVLKKTPTPAEGNGSSSGSTGPVGGEPPPALPKPHSKVLPFVVGGIGVASLAASGVFYFVLRNGQISKLNDACGSNHNACPASSRTYYDNAKTDTLISQITLGVGVVGVGAAVVLLVTGKHSHKAKPADKAGLRLLPAAPGTEAGASLVGRF